MKCSNVISIVNKYLMDSYHIDADELNDHNVDFQTDLGLDSLDMVEMVMAVEEEFDLEIPDEVTDKWTKLKDVYSYVCNELEITYEAA